MKSTLKILFADDDLKYSLVLKRFLEREGYEVTYTGNGTMALEQFPVVKPDLVLLDINMPGLNGFEVAEKIREQDRHVLIFFLSDRDRIMNIFAYNTKTKQTVKVTNFTEYDVKFPSVHGNTIVFENGGYIYKMDAAARKAEKVNITLASDNIYARTDLKKGAN